MEINVNNDGMIGDVNEKALHIELIKKDKEIERLTAESTEWESKFYNEAKKVDKAIEKIHNIYFRIDNISQNNWVAIKLDVTNQGQELLEILDKGEDKE